MACAAQGPGNGYWLGRCAQGTEQQCTEGREPGVWSNTGHAKQVPASDLAPPQFRPVGGHGCAGSILGGPLLEVLDLQLKTPRP